MVDGYRPPIPPLPPEIGYLLRFETFYDRANLIIDRDMAHYTKGVHHICTKQVPNALAYCKTGNPTLNKRPATLQSLGFNLVGWSRDGSKVELTVSEHDPNSVIATKYVEDAVITEHALIEDDPEIDVYANAKFRVAYEDVFRVLAGRQACSSLGRKPPRTLVWPGDGHTLLDQIPLNILLKLEGWVNKPKSKMKFSDLKGVEMKMQLLLKHTFWGRRLQELTYKPYEKDGVRYRSMNTLSVRRWAKMLIERITALLSGHGDPLWPPDHKIYLDREPRSQGKRSFRFVELMKTVNGIFTQCYLAVPEEKWEWEKFDLFTLKNLSCLIGDEFFDGELSEEYRQVTTRYAELKKARKTFKDLSNKEILGEILASEGRKRLVPRWLNFLLRIWDYTRKYPTEVEKLHADGILSQTRGAGQPPLIVQAQSKLKFLRTVSEKPADLTDCEEAVLLAAIRKLDSELDQNIFTGLDTKARVTVNANACWEKSQREGGTVEAISEIVYAAQLGKPCNVRDLSTGEISGELHLKDTSPGTYIFWECLDLVLRTDPRNLSQAAVVMVSEPGKARTVTKATAALKIVLDVVNKICSWPLSKIPSSTSGMEKAAHAWNSFKSSFTEEGKDYVFKEKARSVNTNPDQSVTLTQWFEELWTSSTDYEEATDALHHDVGRRIAIYWMDKCGIPPILQAIVRGTCFVPRAIVFDGRGPLSHVGEEWVGDSPVESPRFITLRKGVLMGDPLTKVVLHLINILVRITGAEYASPQFVSEIFGAGIGTIVLKEIRERQSADQAEINHRVSGNETEPPVQTKTGGTEVAEPVNHGPRNFTSSVVLDDGREFSFNLKDSLAKQKLLDQLNKMPVKTFDKVSQKVSTAVRVENERFLREQERMFEIQEELRLRKILKNFKFNL
jgi:hypothetical protein